MAGDEETDRRKFLLQFFRCRPARHLRCANGHGRLGGGSSEHVLLARQTLIFIGLRRREDRFDTGKSDGALGADVVERTGADQGFKGASIDELGIDALTEIAEIAESFRASRLDDRLRGLATHALDGRQRVTDRALSRLEQHARAVDRRRLELDRKPRALLPVFCELVGVRHFMGHRRCEEFYRVVGLEISRLIGEKRVRGGMRFVEAVFGKFGAGVEHGLGGRRRDGAGLSALEKAATLGIHLRLDLLAHGAAQEIGFRKAVAGELARDLLHLFLIGDDAESLAQKRLELGVKNLDALAAELTGAVDGDVRHRDPADRAPRAR